MIIENGIIQVYSTTGGGMLNGKPQAVVETLGRPIPCNWRQLNHSNQGRSEDSAYTSAGFEVLIAPQPFNAERVLLTDTLMHRTIGQCMVQSIEPLGSTEAIKITLTSANNQFEQSEAPLR